MAKGWGADAPASDPDGAGLLLLLVANVVFGLLNLIGRLVFRFGWDLRVSREASRWPHRRKTVLRRRFPSKSEALTVLPALVEEVRSAAPE